jgi:hypothetical protein
MKLIKIQKRVLFTYKSKHLNKGSFAFPDTTQNDPTMSTMTVTLTGASAIR